MAEERQLVLQDLKKLHGRCVVIEVEEVIEEETEEIEESIVEPIVEVEPVEEIPAQLFGITFRIEEGFIQSANEILGIVAFEGFGTEPTSVSLTFTIFNEQGKEILREEASLVVETEKVLFKSFENLELPEGKYTIVLITLYNVDVVDEFVQEFEIIDGGVSSSNILSKEAIISSALVLLVISFIIWQVVHRKKRSFSVFIRESKGDIFSFTFLICFSNSFFSSSILRFFFLSPSK